MRRRRRHPAPARHLAALGLYAAAALLLTWPLARQLTTHVPGDGIDDPALAWNLWWLKTRLVDQLNWDIFHTGWMFHPVRINLAFYTLTPLNGLQSIPLQTALQPIIAANLILLSTFVLGGYGMFLLALYLQARLMREENTGRRPVSATLPALFAGLVYGFASAKLFYAALGQFNIASSHWVPFAALYTLAAVDSDSPRSAARNGLLAGLFIAFQAWSELTYASFLLIFCALVAVWKLAAIVRSPSSAGSQLRTLALAFAAAALVFAAGVAPFLAAMLPDLRTYGDFFASGGGFADIFSADLMGYLAPTKLHPLLGKWTAQLPFPNDKGQHIYLGYSLMAFTLAVAVFRHRLPPRARGMAGFWLLSALVFWSLTLGPYVRWAGNDLPIPGPFALISRLPFFSGNRYPSRYSVMLLLSAAALSIYALRLVPGRGSSPLSAHCKPQRRRDREEPPKTSAPLCDLRAFAENLRRALHPITQRSIASALIGLLAAVFLFEHLSAPLPLNDLRTPPIYRHIASAPGDFAILELPTGWRNGARILGKSDVLIMMQQWHQTAHGKRRLGGNTSRNPAYKFQYFTEAPLIGDLIALMNADRQHIAAAIAPEYDALVARNKNIAPDVLAFLGVQYVVVHVDKSPELLQRFVEDALPVELVDTWQEPASAQPGDPAPAAGTSQTRLYRVRSIDPPAAWEIDLSAPAGKLHLASGWSALEVETALLRYATQPVSELLLALPAQGGILSLELSGAESAGLSLNGRPLTSAALTPGDAPAWVNVEIPPSFADEPVDRLAIAWRGKPSPLSALPGATNANLAVRSAGEEVGDFAHLYVNGEDVAPNTRGYNLAALTPDGRLLAAAAFDTHGDPQASHAMAAWLQQWSAGTIIAGAVADEAGHSLQPEAVDALKRLGVQTDLRGHFRWSHAFIGAAGAAPGSALEQAGLLAPATVFVGPPIDAPAAYGAAGRVRFSSSD